MTYNTHNWDTYKKEILGEDYTPIALSSLPDPVSFNHLDVKTIIHNNSIKCNTLLHNTLTSSDVDIKQINQIPFTTLSEENTYSYDAEKFRNYIKYIDMVANLTPEDKANSVVTFKKLINYYAENVIGCV
jgi:hypothetical protein